MLVYIFIGAIWIIVLLLYIFNNNNRIASRLFKKVFGRDGKRKRNRSYLEQFRESKQSEASRNIIVQILPWLSVLAIFFILGNQYFYFGTVLSGSMEPLFKKGDLVLMQTVDKDPEIGDIIMYTSTIIEKPITHRIISIDQSGIIRTKGDANAYEDTWDVTVDNIMGEAIIIKDKPLILRGLGLVLVPEAGKFSIMNKMPKSMTASVLFEQYQYITPFIVFFATIFYFLVLIETRTNNERKFSRNGKDRTK